MLLGFDPEISDFLAGSTLGVVLLIVGLGLGLWLGRWGERQRSGRPAGDSGRALEMFNTLNEYMSQVSATMADHRRSVDQWDERVRRARLEDEADPAAEAIAAANAALREKLDAAEQTLAAQCDAVASYVAEARTDALTGLPNRRALDETLAGCWSRWRAADEPFSVILIDVDHFKSFNDRLGHQAGDVVLRLVAEVLAEVLEHDWFLGRYGGEEFAIVVAGDAPDASRRAGRLARQAIESGEYLLEGRPHRLTASCGLATVRPGDRLPDVVRRADEALYASKRAGRNCAHWHDGTRCRVLDVGLTEHERPQATVRS